MKPSELLFCLHNGELLEDDPTITVITFCPTFYWAKHKCLQESYSDNQIDLKLFSDHFRFYPLTEECQLFSRENESKIRSELIAMGFVENCDMQKFLCECWG